MRTKAIVVLMSLPSASSANLAYASPWLGTWRPPSQVDLAPRHRTAERGAVGL